MEAVVALADGVGLIAWNVALVVGISLRNRPRMGTAEGGPLFGAAIAVFVFVSFSNVLQHAGVTSALDPVEDRLEVLFPILVAYGLYMLQSAARLDEVRRGARALRSQHDLLESIIDTTPVGIAVVDDRGRVTFANDPARKTLELADDPDTGRPSNPGWRVFDPEAGPGALRHDTLLCDAGFEAMHDELRVLEWPDGRTKTLSLSSTALADRTGGVGGCVLSLEDVTDRLPGDSEGNQLP